MEYSAAKRMIPKGSAMRDLRTARVEFWTLRTALGWIGIAGCEGKLSRLVFGFSSRTQVERAIARHLGAAGRQHAKRRCWDAELLGALDRFARGQRVGFDGVALDESAWTPFQRRVLPACGKVAYGATTSYGRLAKQIGCPRAARAVGRALACNPVPLVIPCHRVVAKDGALRGFGSEGGTAMKQRLLELEKRGLSG
jgi:methylated-DNA-[protein]-cysteine S-methyltransferase